MSMQPGADQHFQVVCREALLWRQLSHPYILPFLGVDAETFASRNALCLVSPWMERGTLKQYITSDSYNPPVDRHRLVRNFLYSLVSFCSLAQTQLHEVAQGIDYLHDESMVHGDINWVKINLSHMYGRPSRRPPGQHLRRWRRECENRRLWARRHQRGDGGRDNHRTERDRFVDVARADQRTPKLPAGAADGRVLVWHSVPYRAFTFSETLLFSNVS
jgi:hypothetical protein